MELVSYLWLVVGIFLIIGVILFLCYWIYILHLDRQYEHIPGPPIESVLVGHLGPIREVYKEGGYTHSLFLRWACEYGPVYRIRIFHKVMLILSGQDGIKEVLTRTRYQKSQMTYGRLSSVCDRRFLGTGLVTSWHHSSWAQRRAAINPAFHKRTLSDMMSQFNGVADEWLEHLMPLAGSNSFSNMADWLSRVTLDVIGQVGFGETFHAMSKPSSEFNTALGDILEGYSAQLKDPLIMYRYSRRELVRRVQKSVKVLREKGRELLQTCARAGSPRTILDYIFSTSVQLDAEDTSHPGASMEDMLDEFCTLLIAGQETTSNLLAFLLKEVGDHPEILQRLVDEVDDVVGDSEEITYQQIGKLDYMTQVIRETLRLYPPAMGTARDSGHGAELHGYQIPANTQLVISFFVVHRIPEYFADPDEFKPGRFDRNRPRKLFTFMPFSLGHRSCAGQHFAMIEAKTLLTKFLQRFTYKLEPGQPNGIQETTTLRPRGGVRLKLSLRHTHNCTS